MAAPLIAVVAAALSANPDQLVLGHDRSAELRVRAPPSARVTFSASVGSVGSVERDGDDVRARYFPPRSTAPSVALVLATVDGEGERRLHWLSLPLSGTDTLSLQTRPRSTVEVAVGNGRFGPAKANGEGVAHVPVVVPPGLRTASLRITDRLGNTNEKEIDLEPPRFVRLRTAAGAAEGSAASPVDVEVFVVRDDGAPDPEARVELSADAGQVEAPSYLGGGIYVGRFVPPASMSGTATIAAHVAGQTALVEVHVRPARGAPAPQGRSSFAGRQPWGVSIGLVGGGGFAFEGAPRGVGLFQVALQVDLLPLEVVLESGAGFAGSRTAVMPQNNWRETTAVGTVVLQLGIRGQLEVVRGFYLEGSISGGLQNQTVRTDVVFGPPREDASWAPRLSLASGVALRAGPGRVLAEMRTDVTGSGAAQSTGSSGGLQIAVGYLITLR